MIPSCGETTDGPLRDRPREHGRRSRSGRTHRRARRSHQRRRRSRDRRCPPWPTARPGSGLATGSTIRNDTLGSAASDGARCSPKPRWCSTECTSSARRASQIVLAPEPHSNTRTGRGPGAQPGVDVVDGVVGPPRHVQRGDGEAVVGMGEAEGPVTPALRARRRLVALETQGPQHATDAPGPGGVPALGWADHPVGHGPNRRAHAGATWRGGFVARTIRSASRPTVTVWNAANRISSVLAARRKSLSIQS